jgi:hypothetical protein
MKSFIKTIAFNEVSYDVALLHKALEVLELPVSKKEVEQKKAGPDTRKKVRTLQKQLTVPHRSIDKQATTVSPAHVLERSNGRNSSHETDCTSIEN